MTLSRAYMNPELPVLQRVEGLISQMTLEEKASQMRHEAPGIDRLGVPPYNWWNECLHGVGRAGIATVFPQAIGLGATWNTGLMFRVASTISDEARAKHHDALRRGNRDIYYGLTFWTPNINIFRDPRWGRGQETYGEDPYLTGRLGVQFVRGLQGDDPKYLKTVATPKHYAVHSGPEHGRHEFDAKVSAKDLRETYLPAFEACVREAGAMSVMGAYNRTNGSPCCAHVQLLAEILRREWGFGGYVVSDCGAIEDIYQGHRVVKISEKAVALAVKAGCDLCCGKAYESLVSAVKMGLLSEEEINRSVRRLFTARFRLGMFDPPERVPYAAIPIEQNDCPVHRAVALEAARESIVLLKNENNFLPLRKDTKSLAMIGPNADDVQVLLGNYNGTPSKAVTILEGIRAKVGPTTAVLFGDYNPAGRLPVTFYRSVKDLPAFEDYRMAGRTYRYFAGPVLYPFGFGLSYTAFAYSNLRIDPAPAGADQPVTVRADVENVGPRDGDEVVQLYVTDVQASVSVPIQSLQGFNRVHLKKGAKTTVTFTLKPEQLALVDNDDRRKVEPGEFRISVGGGQPGTGAASVSGSVCVG